MTTTPEGAARQSNAQPWLPLTVVVAVLVALVGAFLAGLSSGRHQAQSGDWHVGHAQTGIREVSIEYDGWWYGALGSVPAWVDAAGAWHDGGWPDCLRPVGTHPTVRFQARTVAVGDTTTRPIVAIDCSGFAG
jgi:hypothetical protein